jgi:hypothetical protein
MRGKGWRKENAGSTVEAREVEVGAFVKDGVVGGTTGLGSVLEDGSPNFSGYGYSCVRFS